MTLPLAVNCRIELPSFSTQLDNPSSTIWAGSVNGSGAEGVSWIKSGQERHAKGEVVHRRRRLVMILFGLRVLLMAETVFKIMVHEVWVLLDSADNWCPLCLPISRGVEDGLNGSVGVNEYVMVF